MSTVRIADWTTMALVLSRQTGLTHEQAKEVSRHALDLGMQPMAAFDLAAAALAKGMNPVEVMAHLMVLGRQIEPVELGRRHTRIVGDLIGLWDAVRDWGRYVKGDLAWLCATPAGWLAHGYRVAACLALQRFAAPVTIGRHRK